MGYSNISITMNIYIEQQRMLYRFYTEEKIK